MTYPILTQHQEQREKSFVKLTPEVEIAKCLFFSDVQAK
jgi:hypothetical protein